MTPVSRTSALALMLAFVATASTSIYAATTVGTFVPSGSQTTNNIPTDISCTNDFTWEVWFNASDLTLAENRMVAQTGWAWNDAGRLVLEIRNHSSQTSGKPKIAAFYYNSGNVRLCGTTEITAGWHHAALVRSSTTLTIYLDGNAECTTDEYVNNTPYGTDSAPFLISPAFAGSLSEIRVWNVARTAAQIKSCYASRCVGNESGLIGYWPMTEGSGAPINKVTGTEATMSIDIGDYHIGYNRGWGTFSWTTTSDLPLPEKVVVWRNSGTDVSGGTASDQANGSYTCNFCLPALDGVPTGSVVKITNISFGSRNSSFSSSTDSQYLRVYPADGGYYTILLNGTGAFDGSKISAYGTLVPRLSYSHSGIPVTVGVTNKFEFLYFSGGTYYYMSSPGFKMVRTYDTSSAVSISDSLAGNGYYPVYEITATVVSLGEAADTSTTVSGDASLSELTWSTALTNDGTQWGTLGVTADATLTLDATTNFKLLTINVASGKTLTLTGANALTATKIEISGEGTVKTAAQLFAGAFTGGGTLVYSGILPSNVSFGYDWCGTLALENKAVTGPNFNNYGNVASKVQLSGITGWINTGTEYAPEIVLENGDYDFALKINNGNSPQNNTTNPNRCSMFRKWSGSGSLVDDCESNANLPWPVFKVYDASDFAGDITLSRMNVIVCDSTTTYSDTLYNMFVANNGRILIESGKKATLASGKTWSVNTINSYGDFTGGGTIEGAGYILFSGALPTGTYVNDTWTGTIAISNVATVTGLNGQNYGNANSTIELIDVGYESGYFSATPTFPGKLVLTDGATNALSLTNGYSTSSATITELAGSGTLKQSNSGIRQGITINVMTNFTGTLSPYNMNVSFGTTDHSNSSATNLYIESDAVLSVPAGFALWAPTAIDFNGPVNFTTDETNFTELVLFSNVGSNLNMGENAVIKLNGETVSSDKYIVKVVGTNLILKPKGGMAIIIR